MSRYPHVAAAIFETPWLITPKAMRAIVEVMELRLEGGRMTASEIAERLAVAERTAGPRGGARQAGGVRVIPVYGVLSQRANMMSDMSGGTSVEAIARQFREAQADPEVAAILFDVDSPGGSVAGIPELADEIRAARGGKPMASISHSLMASAAFFIGCQVDELIVTPSSLTGSVGVVMAHQDFSAQEEQLGIKTTLVHAGDHKVETYDTVPLSADAEAYMQSLVDDVYSLFVNGAAKGRGMSAAAVKADFGGGRVLSPKRAVAVGMADRVDTYENTVMRLAQGKVATRSIAAVEELPPITAGVQPDPREASAPVGSDTPDRTVEAAAALELARARARR